MAQFPQGATSDFFHKFNLISSKLKKRFLRKPNASETSDQFCALATECEQQELWQYAGLCWLAAARCQGTLKNVVLEMNLLLSAGRTFLKADKKQNDIGCPSLGQENLQEAISCFNESLALCSELPGFTTFSAGLALELAAALGTNGVNYLRKAIEIYPTPNAISCLASCYIRQGDYVTALQVLTELIEHLETNIPPGGPQYFFDLLHRYEVTRLLLLLILQPSPQMLKPSLAQVLEKYAWDEEDTNVGEHMSENELILLQSLVLACQTHDIQAVLDLEVELWQFLNAEQKELFLKLIHILNSQ
ncbi:40-kDa huntingtin-associated protein [Prorops nasuta]|uniref:40-kDa huntingtin-associated protein n=1 Tax=Prorops nasuta TaxID=863751 RepID=UPI0034CDAD4B